MKGIDKLTRKIVDTKKNKLYSLIYLLIILALILLVVMTTVIKGIFNYEFCEKSSMKSYKRSIIERYYCCIYKKDLFCILDDKVIL